jgi:FtsP/CotA-like multicopper oxidase with cupredoxin domain
MSDRGEGPGEKGGLRPVGGERSRLSRRELIRVGVAGAAGIATAGAAMVAGASGVRGQAYGEGSHGASHDAHSMGAVGSIEPGGFDPVEFLTRFDYGRETRLENGQTLREYEIVATDREIEISPGVFFPAWTYNGQVPGPTLRCTEGDRVRVRFSNAGSHPHTIHFHGIHAAAMDGVFEVVEPGGAYTYEFDAEPFGLQIYHCHAIPLKRHIHKGLYGMFIIDPPGGRPPARELVMVMNGFDTNFDNDNEVYAVNSVAFHYQNEPIRLQLNELTRVYLANLTEFDLLNSFHLHGNFFRAFRTGSNLERFDYTDTLMLCQGERAVLEFSFKHEGRFMFHAHQSEFAELGWMGIFDVRRPDNA